MSISDLKKLLPKAMIADRIRFQRQIGSLEKDASGKIEERLSRLAADIDKSVKFAELRGRQNFQIHYDPDLPVNKRKEEIARIIRDNQITVICGETGSGKSTQIPKICLELGRGIFGTIGHTQPRRIAARSVAARIAEELQSPLGQTVGYKVRFADQCGPQTRVKLMTDGILLAESQTDPFFNQYDTIIVDEAHERSLNIDFLLGMFRRILPRRKDLKLIITSATIDAQKFAAHFSTARIKVPVIEVSGRSWPIDIVYRPIDSRESEEEDAKKLSEEDAFERAVCGAVDELARKERGDILIFMPTEHDIFETAKLLKHHAIPGDDSSRKTEILPLYARLPAAEQQKIFQPSRWRRIVIATNVAESSLTVPGIKYVIDTGTARISRYSARSKTQRLPVEAVSRASADQRAGRCGRVGPGICIRLYGEDDYLARDRYTTPEIRRTNLASVILQTKAFRLGAVEKFPFIDPPSYSSISDGYKTLFELGALDKDQELTERGKQLARLPVDPRIGRMILAGAEEDCLREILIIASILELQDPRERPVDHQQAADEKHLPFIDDRSDFLSFLKLWDFWQHLKDTLSRSQLRKACKENFLSWNRMTEWSEIHLQLNQMARDSHLKGNVRKDDPDAIHRAVLAGLLFGIAKKTETQEYQTTGNTKFFLWPGSGLTKKKYPWIVACERLETSRKYLRTVAKINPDWIEPLAEHLLEHHAFEPFWNPDTGHVSAYERVSLYGLTVIPKRTVNYGPKDPEKARLLFIQGALVEDQFPNPPEFFIHNRKILEEARSLQDKLRNWRLLRGEEVVSNFYHERIPAEVYDAYSLKKWLNKASASEKKNLFMSLDMLCAEEIPENIESEFPDRIRTSLGIELPLDYRFHPGDSDDGISLCVLPQSLNQIDRRSLGWLVHGLLEQKIAALLKTLPKEIRRELVPVPETAAKIRDQIAFGEGDFLEAVAHHAGRIAGRLISVSDFDESRLSPDLMMNIKVHNEEGKLLAEGRDLDELREKLGISITESFASINDPKWNRDGLKKWDFGSLPESISVSGGSMKLKGYPAICDPRFLGEEKNFDAKSVSLRIFDSQDRADRQSRFGLYRLFCFQHRDELIGQAKWIPGIQKSGLLIRSAVPCDIISFTMELLAAIALSQEDSFLIPRNEGDFNRLMQKGQKNIGFAVQDATRWIDQFAPVCQAARLLIERNVRVYPDIAADIDKQLQRLLVPGFHWEIPWNWLKEYPRFLRAITVRFDKIQSGGISSDRQSMEQLADLQNQYDAVKEKNDRSGIRNPDLELYRWMLEEYRVSLFAQKLGTSMKISMNRLEKQWEKIR
ncbi:MAG: ATP-dependent RNA helicase HrpA [Planctomycetia bacterium]|nr:ATP-dependent RNA helicase HrpA [Planctomycetia bacterium]